MKYRTESEASSSLVHGSLSFVPFSSSGVSCGGSNSNRHGNRPFFRGRITWCKHLNVEPSFVVVFGILCVCGSLGARRRRRRKTPLLFLSNEGSNLNARTKCTDDDVSDLDG
jgi:hypothetical protein